MFTTGTKFLIGSTVIASIAALAYGLTQDGIMGTVGLVSAALALAFLSGVNIYTRDSNVLVTPDLVPEGTRRRQGRPVVQPVARGLRLRDGRGGRRARDLPGHRHHRPHRGDRRRCGMDDPGVFRAGVGRQRPQRRSAQPDGQPVRIPHRRCRRHRHRDLLVQPHHALAVEDEHRARLRRARRRSSSPSPSSSPIARRSSTARSSASW